MTKTIVWTAIISAAVATVFLARPWKAASPPSRAREQARSARQVPAASAGTLRDVQSLDVYAEGNAVHLLLLTQGGSGEGASARLFYARADAASLDCSEPVRVAQGGADAFSVSRRGNDVQVAASGRTVLAAWQASGTGYGNRGPLCTARSTDGGETWALFPAPEAPGRTGDQGFHDLLADGAGGFHLVWLDNRTGKKGLHHARVPVGGAWSHAETIAEETCMCCWNTLARAPGGAAYVLYRDATPRDMALAGLSGTGDPWKIMGKVGAFGWDFQGCPHVGGGLAAVLEAEGANPVLHALVWTGKEEEMGVYHLRSEDGGRSWSSPRSLGDGSASHPDLAAKGLEVAAVWDADFEGGKAVFGAFSADGGRSWSRPGRFSSVGSADHPRVVSTPSGFRVFWTEMDSSSRSVGWRGVAWDLAGPSQLRKE